MLTKESSLRKYITYGSILRYDREIICDSLEMEWNIHVTQRQMNGMENVSVQEAAQHSLMTSNSLSITVTVIELTVVSDKLKLWFYMCIYLRQNEYTCKIASFSSSAAYSTEYLSLFYVLEQ